jgi:hypothetical protein
MAQSPYSSNLILASLPATDLDLLLPQLRFIDLPQETVLFEAGGTISRIFFPHSGIRRTSVTLAASPLKRQKLIRFSRGQVTVVDRSGLEQRSCECYEVSKRELDRLLGPPHGVPIRCDK